MTDPSPSTRATFALAASAFADQVARIGAAGSDAVWDGPGLGDWDLRALVGHASRSLVTVLTYLPRTTEIAAVTSVAQYYQAAVTMMAADPVAVTERGRQAGAALGDDPVATVRDLVDRCRVALDATPGDPVIETIVGGMHLEQYLVTRSFELVVHGLDIGAATGRPYDPPAAALTESLRLAVDVAVLGGRGPELLLALTGRRQLPAGFSVV
ncbi:maleylpyruvate isomerase N-terminal domain-containing protein [Nakamurella sp.]|uniref:maleylpyruvate isomerase N-terminal domain-containing protein n=1 Tax=Nakamurella sp. TaxID=1869182 RepID=UPI003784168E